jgi:hypothetical protein
MSEDSRARPEVKMRPDRSDAGGMRKRKRAILWTIGGTAFLSSYAAAASLSKVASESWDEGVVTNVVTRCGSLNPFTWFSADCSDLLIARIGPLVLGLGLLAICAYFADRGRQPGSVVTSG